MPIRTDGPMHFDPFCQRPGLRQRMAWSGRNKPYEKVVLSLQMNVYSERNWGNEPMDSPEVREAVALARELFPEIQLLDIEPVMRDPR